MRLLSLFSAISLIAISHSQAIERGQPLPRRGALGVQLAALSADEAKAGPGVKAVGVLPGLTGETLKLQAGDIVTAINGTAVASPQEISAKMRTLFARASLELSVRRGDKTVTLKGKLAEKPKQKEAGQTIVYDQVVSQGKRVRVIGTHPVGKGPFPTVFLIGGIGAYSVDSDFAAMPYGKIFGPLAKAGYATIRIDKPGQGDSEGPQYTDLLFDQEMDAYLQALRLAKTLPWVNKDKIVIFGHSMGGTFGPLLAAQETVAGIAVGGTLGKTWIEYNLENSRRQMLLSGASAADVDTAMRQEVTLNHYLYNLGLSPKEIIEKHPESAAAMREMSPDLKTYSGVGIAFFQQLAKKNIMEAWTKTDAKAWIYCGENDFIASLDDHPFIVDAINKRKPGQAELKILKDSDHGFTTTSSMSDSMAKWGRPGAVHNSNIEESLLEWLGRVTK